MSSNNMKNFILLILLLTLTAFVWVKLGYYIGRTTAQIEREGLYSGVESTNATTAEYYNKFVLRRCLEKLSDMGERL